MRWEDERYVRLYTRDTPDWLCLSFLAQGLFCLLLRKVDRAGVLTLGKAGRKGVAIAIGHAHEWPKLQGALEELLSDGCIHIEGDNLVVPNFLEAQEALASDKARAKKHRERARDLARSGGVTQPEPPPDPVSPPSQHGTERHATPDLRDSSETERDASETGRDKTVTPSLAVPSRADPCLASQQAADGTDRGSVAEPSDAGAPARPPAQENGHRQEEHLVLDLEHIPDEEAATAKAELEARLRSGYGRLYEKRLEVSAKKLLAETVEAWIGAVRRFGRAAVVGACLDDAADYWRRTSGGAVGNLRFFLPTLKRLRPATRPVVETP